MSVAEIDEYLDEHEDEIEYIECENMIHFSDDDLVDHS